ncbi:flavonoid 3',5'-hydroxylase 1-like [Euphorbia lathyris]|uniref:flavonoid 3',5'-hydroxylase 1-like n=1 Tax=Euphorbia lathyris TaxID=212925 RepID=UPI003313AA69
MLAPNSFSLNKPISNQFAFKNMSQIQHFFSFCSWELYLTLTISLLGILLLSNILKKSTPQLPPGPQGLPVLGYLPFLGTFLHKNFTELAAKYGPIYKLWLGNKLCVVISSPSLAKQVLRDNDKIFANHEPPVAARIISYGRNDIAFRLYDPEWMKMRKVFVRGMLNNASIDALYQLRKQEMHKGIRHAYTKAGEVIDFGELVFGITVNSAISMLCGGALKGEKATLFIAEFRKLAEELMILLGRTNISDVFPILASFDLQGIEKQARKLHLKFDKILNSVIEQRLQEEKEEKKEGKRDFLQILLDYHNQGDAQISITMNQVKALLLDIVVGGTDTTSTILEWTMSEIMLNEEVKNKVYRELEEVVGINNELEESHLPNLKYLDAVCKEANRLHPAILLLVPHLSSESCTIGGYTIPKGTSVFLNVYAIHKDPVHWENPLEFMPERFLKNNGENFDYLGNNFKYLPFGSGRRVCAGIPLAERGLMYILGSMLHSFEWTLPHGTKLDLSDKFGIVIKKGKPLMLVPKPRGSGLELY